MNTTDKNILIAEFMGAVQNKRSKDFDMYLILDCVEDGEDEQHHFLAHQMLFSSDWNWLMEVVRKIRYLETHAKGEFLVELLHYKRNNRTIFDLDILEGIEYVYNAVIAFIEWYNKQ